MRISNVNIPDKEALWRLSYRTDDREDDTLAAIRKRIGLFHEVTEPVIDHYRKKRILTELDGEKPIEEISREILESIKK